MVYDFLKRMFIFIFPRYPTNKWIKLGTFHGRDERNVQSFPLDEQMYAKYVKVMLIPTGLCFIMKTYLLFIPFYTSPHLFRNHKT